MKIGLVCRMTDRGLGWMTRRMVTNLHPDAVLVIDNPGDRTLHMENHPEWYPPGTPTVTWDGTHLTPPRIVSEFLDKIDVCYSAETFYDWAIVESAHRRGVATVCHGMPEMHRHHIENTLPMPTMWWNPTSWLLDRYPLDTLVVPVPCPAPVPEPPSIDETGLRIVHVIGHQAAGDRNGTESVIHAIPRIQHPVTITVTCQDKKPPTITTNREVTVKHVQTVTDSADLYRDQDVLLLPRKYGGLSIPVLEAMSAGLAVAMTFTPPQSDIWPILPIAFDYHRDGHRAPGGVVPTAVATGKTVATTVDAIAGDSELLQSHQAKSLEWAHANTWDELRPRYLDALQQACDKARAHKDGVN